MSQGPILGYDPSKLGQFGFPSTTGPYNPTSGTLNSGAVPSGDWRTPPINDNTAPSGSALEKYYKRMVANMPTPRQQSLGDLGSILGSFAGGERTNRVVKGNFQGVHDDR